MLALPMVILPKDWAFMAYFVLDEWRDGFSIGTAVKDACYAMNSMGWPSMSFVNVPPSSTQKAIGPLDDHATAVCTISMYLKVTEVQAPQYLMDTADPVSTAERAEAYLKACREVYAALAPGRQRAILDALPHLLGTPVEVQNITAPIYHGPKTLEEYFAMRARRDAAAAAKPDLAPRRQNATEAEPPRVREALAAHGDLQPVQPEIVPASQVAQALYEGRVVQFDATEMLPSGIWNLTIPKIAEMHGSLADEIPIYRMNGASNLFGWNSLRQVGRQIELLEKANKLYHPSSVPVPRDPLARPGSLRNLTEEMERQTANESFAWTPEESLRKLLEVLPASRESTGLTDLLSEVASQFNHTPEGFEDIIHGLRVPLSQFTVNVRRLPRIPEIDLKKALGNPDWVERSWSLLWSGAMGSWWHNDEPDNMLIAVNREITVAVFEMNDTDVISGMRGPFNPFFDLDKFHPDKVTPEWLEQNQWIKKFPYVRVHLKPGMGVTVPSRAYHSIWAQDSDRLLLNGFLLPKYGALESAPRPPTSFFSPGQQHERYMALYHLKMASIGRLWDTRHLGGFFELLKLEIL